MQHKQIIFYILTFFIFSSTVPYYRHGTICIKTNYVASDYYRKKTHQFLKHLKVKNPEQVIVRLTVDCPILLSEKEAYPAYTLGLTNQNGIWLNENALEKYGPEERLFVIAHEAAHYALKHSQAIETLDTRLTWLTNIITGIVACVSIFNEEETNIEKKLPPIFKENKQLKLLVKGIKTTLSSALFYFGFYCLKKDRIKNLHIKVEEEANKIATYLLCDLGHESLIQKRIENLQAEIKSGNGNWTDGEHPTTEQQYKNIKKYLMHWKRKYADQSNAAYIKT